MHDIIGDIHGHCDELHALLKKMGYENTRGCWRHPERTALFVGDFIDKGPKQLETLDTVRRMVEGGAAQAVMGNHEFNAIAWALPDPDAPGQHLRRHTESNRHQHGAFLDAVGDGSALHQEWAKWFLELPLWLELPELRLVHACWHPRYMEYLAQKLRSGNRLSEALMVEASREPEEAIKDNPEPSVFKAVECLVKGIETNLPDGCSFIDAYGHQRRRVRVKWWEPAEKGFRELAMGLTEEQQAQLPATPVAAHHAFGVQGDKPVFIGHYWLTGTPAPLSEKVVCVDYSVAKGGELVGWREGGYIVAK